MYIYWRVSLASVVCSLTQLTESISPLQVNTLQACVEAIKTIYWTLSSMGDGPQASAPVEEEAQALIRSTINDVVLQLMSRALVLSNLATTLALAQGTNPLRPLRYLMNCMLKIWEIRLSDLVRPYSCSSCFIRIKLAAQNSVQL
jgi:uncharacterized protein YybS (DUF2232 family)